MTFDGSLLTFTLVATVLALSPGPDTFLTLRNTLGGGLRSGLATVCGIIAGGSVHAALAAFGLTLILVQSAQAFFWVKLVGAGYLLFLGLQSLRAGFRRAPDTTLVPARPGGHRGRAFAEGFLTNALNPKVAVFYLAFLPQFIAPGDPVAAKSFLLAGIHYAIGFVWLSTVAFAVSRAARLLTRPGVRRATDLTTGAIFTGFGVRLAFEQR
jgi:threonine/homoserine/homoserine lactone efflux protein